MNAYPYDFYDQWYGGEFSGWDCRGDGGFASGICGAGNCTAVGAASCHSDIPIYSRDACASGNKVHIAVYDKAFGYKHAFSSNYLS